LAGRREKFRARIRFKPLNRTEPYLSYPGFRVCGGSRRDAVFLLFISGGGVTTTRANFVYEDLPDPPGDGGPDLDAVLVQALLAQPDPGSLIDSRNQLSQMYF
jgi:hypothetical protein